MAASYTPQDYMDALAKAGVPAWLKHWGVRSSTRRRRSIGAEVSSSSGSVVFTVPATCTPQAFASQAPRMFGRLAAKVEQAKSAAPAAEVHLTAGQGFRLFDRSYRLKLTDTPDAPDVELRYCPLGQRRPGDDTVGSMGSAQFLCVRRKLNPTAAARALARWYGEEGARYAAGRVQDIAHRLGVDPGLKFTVRTDLRRTRTFGLYKVLEHSIWVHWTIFQLPRPLIEYVLTHEVAHAATRRENAVHGPQWRRTMDLIMPDWRDRKARLKAASPGMWRGQFADPSAAEPAAVAESPEPEPTPRQDRNAAAKYRRRVEMWAGKFAAETVSAEPARYLEPNNANLAAVFAPCVKPPTPVLYPDIRAKFIAEYLTPASTATAVEAAAERATQPAPTAGMLSWSELVARSGTAGV